MAIELRLPYPPSVNTYWRKWNNRMVISAKGRNYRQAVQSIAYCEKILQIENKVKVKIIACPPDKRRRDIDNILKALLDSLTFAGVWTDDSLVKKLCIEMLSPDIDKQGYCDVKITELE